MKRLLGGVGVSYESRMKSESRDYFWCRTDLYPISSENGIKEIACIVFDIDEYKRAVLNAEKDAATGFLNKPSVFREIRSLINKNKEGRHAFVFIDLDFFKEINDTYGHSHGDVVLNSVAERIKAVVDKCNASVGRFGGDEFLLFIQDFGTEDALKECLSALVEYKVGDTLLTASIGCSIYPEDGQSIDELFIMADTAVYLSKAKGRARYSFYRDTDFEIRRKIRWEEGKSPE